MSDNYYESTFGPSVQGHLNLISGRTRVIPSNIKGVVNGTVIGNPDPVRDDCSSFLRSSGAISMVGKNTSSKQSY